MRRGLVVAFAALGTIALAGTAAAAPPSSAVLVTGVGVAGVSIGSPVAQVKRAWGVRCFAARPGEGDGSCQGITKVGGALYIAQVSFDQNGKVTAVTARDPRWRTRGGVGAGMTIARLRAAYGARLDARVTRVWSYFEVPSTVGGQRRLTSFLGRTKVGDVVSVTITNDTPRVLRATARPGGGMTVTGTGFSPLADYDLRVSVPWGHEDLPATRALRLSRSR